MLACLLLCGCSRYKFWKFIFHKLAVASERNQRCGGEAKPEAAPHQLEGPGLWECCKLPQWSGAKPRVLVQMTTHMDFKWIETYRSLTIIQAWQIIARAKRYFRPRGFSIAGASAPVTPTVPTPLQGSVVTRIRCGGIFNDYFIYYRFSAECTSERIWKNVQYLVNLRQTQWSTFFDSQCLRPRTRLRP